MATQAVDMTKVLLLDGDIIAYKHASGAEEAIDWGDDVWTLHTDTRKAKKMMNAEIETLAVALDADKVLVALSSRSNFRHNVDASYKAGRKKSRKPIGLPCLREELMTEWDGKAEPDLEADDLLGVWATDPMFHAGAKKIIVSVDKDMQTIPCYLYNQNHPELGTQEISKREADWYHLYQTLVGDSTDGYAGCPTIGPTKARRLLDTDPTWKTVVKAYVAQNLSEGDALVQARLARILRIENYNYKNRKIRLWNPS